MSPVYANFTKHFSEKERKHAPDDLFYEGDVSLLLEGRRVAVVGSRKASPEGLRRAKILTKALVAKEITVVSGLAAGIDTVAHKTAIEQEGKTITVLGTPLDVAYPKENSELLETIKTDHLAISQFPEGTEIQRKNFPIRNRTMALISDATIIVEAGENSGTRHQGWEALRLGRMVYLMQNLVDDPELTWPKEMIEYGAQVLTRENLSELLDAIPHFTEAAACAY